MATERRPSPVFLSSLPVFTWCCYTLAMSFTTTELRTIDGFKYRLAFASRTDPELRQCLSLLLSREVTATEVLELFERQDKSRESRRRPQ